MGSLVLTRCKDLQHICEIDLATAISGSWLAAALLIAPSTVSLRNDAACAHRQKGNHWVIMGHDQS